MRLAELNPRWWADSTDGTTGRHLGVTFDCPHCPKEHPLRLSVAFSNPIGGGEPYAVPTKLHWQRTGEDFETLTLTPSIDASGFGHWHGFIQNGEVS